MSLLRGSLSLTSCGPSAGRGLARSRNWASPRTQPVRVASVVRSGGEAYPAGEEFDVASNQVAPPVGNVFGSEEKQEVNALEDPLGFVKGRLERKVQKVKQAFQSVEEAVAPSPYAPVQSDDAVIFVCLSVFLIFSFWLGNYVVPTWIFKDTVFREIDEDERVQEEKRVQEENPSEEEVDPADLIELPTNLMPFRGAAVSGFKAGRQKARDSAEKWRKKKAKRK